MNKNVIPISEIFRSIQGEGTTVGYPSIFVRLMFCNEACTFCDTPYTWNAQLYNLKEETTFYTCSELFVRINTMNLPKAHIVFTGGEPLLHWKKLLPLIQDLKRNEYIIEVETNGTIKVNKEFFDLIDYFNISIKLENSGNPYPVRVKEKAITFFVNNIHDNVTFKFVASSNKDMKEIISLIKLFKIPYQNVSIMPLGITHDEIRSSVEKIIDLCLKYNIRITPRLQVDIWGDKRGK